MSPGDGLTAAPPSFTSLRRLPQPPLPNLCLVSDPKRAHLGKRGAPIWALLAGLADSRGAESLFGLISL